MTIRFEDLGIFVRTATLGSFSRAAREAGLLPGQASAAVARLEKALDVRLFARSTRSLRLTAEGEQYLPYARDVLATLREGGERLRGAPTELRGTLQIAVPSDLGRNVVLPWITGFRRRHPRLDLRLLVSDQVADVFRDPVDIALRYGRMEDASFVALPLVPENRRVAAAAPAYLERHGEPATLDALREHPCLLYTLLGRVHDKWLFEEDGRQRVIEVSGPLMSDDADVVRRWAVAGEGIVYKSRLDIADDLRAGRLRQVLAGYPGEPTPLHLVCPHRKQFSAAVQALYAFLRERFEAMAHGA